MARRTNCPACHQRVIWAITEAGKRQMLDWAPDPAGNVAAEQDVHGTWHARYAPPGQELIFPFKRYMPHAATSPACFRRGQQAPELPQGVTGIAAWKAARAAQGKAARRRSRRRDKPVTGVRWGGPR